MPFGVKPLCSMCKTTVSSMWRKNDKGEVMCNSCVVRTNQSQMEKKESCQLNLRKSTRAKSSKFKQFQIKFGTSKGKGRRAALKKPSTKAPTAMATPITTEALYHKGTYYQVGDIVSLVDEDDEVYYAQIRGLLQDQYCEKSIVITWLIPTQSSPKDYFNPATYILGPEEDIPRKLDCAEFVCHAPSEYFKSRNSPYPTVPLKPENCFIWTRIGPQIKPLPTKEEVFGSS
ncbi:GATA zinc finger domain-containing protein 1 [Centruroides vittatus]|uniref:GATA zinc finger domain-containing protein 1 n=1 Tax=Centruroides vittatus TaxID=120091 RepID=UPI003510109F